MKKFYLLLTAILFSSILNAQNIVIAENLVEGESLVSETYVPTHQLAQTFYTGDFTGYLSEFTFKVTYYNNGATINISIYQGQASEINFSTATPVESIINTGWVLNGDKTVSFPGTNILSSDTYYTIYFWSEGLGTKEIASSTGDTYTNGYAADVQDGTTVVEYTGKDMYFKITGNNNVGINTLNNNKFSIYPNPTTGNINLSGFENLTGLKMIEITDVTGKIIYQNFQINTFSNYEIDLSEFSNGIYLINIQTDKEVFTQKIIKR